MIKAIKLTIVIPAHNEEDVIISTLNYLKKKLTVPVDIVVVDDHSTDSTAKLVKSYIKRNKRVRFFGNYGVKRGFSSTLRIGFKKSKTEYLLPVMADMCDDPRTINKMYLKISEGWDIICGSRYMKGGSKRGGPVLQSILSMLVCRSLKVLTGIPTHDVSNAFKIYKKSILNKIRLRDGAGVEISMEATLQAYLKGAKITEIPTHWEGRTAGQSKFKIFHRSPKYAKIYFWSIKNSFKKALGMRFDYLYSY